MKKKSCFILLTAMLMMMLSVIPVSAATTKIVPGVVIDEAKGTKNGVDYGLQVGLAGKAKWKSGTYSAELLVPADIVVKNGFFFIEGQLDLRDASIDEHKEDNYFGCATSTAIFFMINSKGKISIKRHNNDKDKWVAMGSASVKAEKVASGKYYLITIKDMPFYNTYYPRDVDWRPENTKPMPTNKTFNYQPKFNLMIESFSKTVKDCFYLVSYSLNTGVKPLTLNFTGNFKGFDGWHNKGEQDHLPVTLKISRVTY